MKNDDFTRGAYISSFITSKNPKHAWVGIICWVILLVRRSQA